MPRAIEHRAPSCRNAIFTAAELLGASGRTKPEVVEVVVNHAARVSAALDPRELFPVRAAAFRCVGAVAILAALPAVLAGRAVPGLPAAIRHVEIVITPPAYLKGTPQTLRDPAGVQAIAGSRLSLRVDAQAAAVGVETVESRSALARQPDGRFTAELPADRDGFIALQASDSGGRSGARTLIGLTVSPDRPPVVRITKPGRDVFTPAADRPLPIEIAAEDDAALASLKLAYTTVRGSGESFEFREGTVPLQIARDGDRRWTATAALDVRALHLSPGDSVVYRALATDGRPQAPPVESDSFMVQIVTPDRASLGGFAVDDEMSRYAISQQMIIIRTERLIARRASMSDEAAAEESSDIAVEQRRLRAEFIFLLGGELEDASAAVGELDETNEAAREEEIAAGRLRNRGYADVMFATRHMGRAATSLAVAEPKAALPEERAALAALQRAFSKDRYLLRSLSTQERLDESRRLGGRLEDVSTSPLPTAAPGANPRASALRRVLAGVAAVASSTAPVAGRAAEAQTLSEQVLRVDPSSAPLRAIATTLSEVSRAMGGGRTAEAAALFDRAAIDLAVAARAEIAPAPSGHPSTDRLKGGLADALRKRQEPR